MAGVGVFPGSFNPPTVAHLSMAAAVVDHYDLDRLDLMVSRKPLAKENVGHPRFDHRIEVLREAAADVPGVEVAVTGLQLLSDIGVDYDLMVLGADKWHQIQQVKWYGTAALRDRAFRTLPRLVVFPRAGAPDPPVETAIRSGLVPPGMDEVSSSRARAGEMELMAPAARRFARATGAWIDLDRYDRWLVVGGCSPSRPSD